MKTPFVIRRVDELGRIVIPIELRRILELESGQEVELTVQSDTLVLRKFVPGCVFCGEMGQMVIFREKNVCAACLRRLTQTQQPI